MTLTLDCPSQRWLVQCDASCSNKILASEGTHAEQHAELERLVDAAGWRYSAEIGHLCAAHAVQLAPPIPRDEKCGRDAWCVGKEGHAGRCLVVPRRPLQETDFGPNAAKRRRY